MLQFISISREALAKALHASARTDPQLRDAISFRWGAAGDVRWLRLRPEQDDGQKQPPLLTTTTATAGGGGGGDGRGNRAVDTNPQQRRGSTRSALFADGSEEPYDLLVAADGVHSRVRTLLCEMGLLKASQRTF